jgi:hypothetical protein
VTVQIIDCEQNSPEWYEARRGIPTASEFAAIMSNGRGKAESLTRRTYLNKLAGEILTGELTEQPTTFHMERGKIMEDEARKLYVFMTDNNPERVGFVRNVDKGASPDSLIGTDGGLEIKTKMPHLQIDVLRRNELPDDHKAQVFGSMWVCEREWWDFVSYWPSLPLFVKRVYRDEKYIAEMAAAVSAFNEELASVVEAIRNYGQITEKAA